MADISLDELIRKRGAAAERAVSGLFFLRVSGSLVLVGLEAEGGSGPGATRRSQSAPAPTSMPRSSLARPPPPPRAGSPGPLAVGAEAGGAAADGRQDCWACASGPRGGPPGAELRPRTRTRCPAACLESGGSPRRSPLLL